VLRASIDENVAALDVLSDEVRPQLARVSQLTEFLRRDDVNYQAELQWCTAPFAAYAGLPPDTLASATELQRVDVARGNGIAPSVEALLSSTPRRPLTEILQFKEAR